MTTQSSFISHLIELRSRVLKALASVLVIFMALAYWAQDLYGILAAPLVATIPEGASMIATSVASPFFAPFKLTMVLSFFIAIPYVLYQVWGFIAPGLYRNEKKLVAPLLLSSTLLFYSGIAFAYFIVFPLAFSFFSAVAPDDVLISPDISEYLSFVLKIFFAFGVAFEIPVAIILMCWTGMTTPDELRKKRSHVIVAAFVVGMLLTPPDVISQVLLAIPMWFLFEVGVVIGGWYTKNKRQDEDEDEDANADDDEENSTKKPNDDNPDDQV
jgi:sec-independent protein translocase protein TatC